MSACPHEKVQFCPLYVESHVGRGLGCIRAGDQFYCDARTPRAYQKMLAAVQAVDPRTVAILAFQEQGAKVREQRSRNMRLLGIQ
jgi:hypothetical protein